MTFEPITREQLPPAWSEAFSPYSLQIWAVVVQEQIVALVNVMRASAMAENYYCGLVPLSTFRPIHARRIGPIMRRLASEGNYFPLHGQIVEATAAQHRLARFLGFEPLGGVEWVLK